MDPEDASPDQRKKVSFSPLEPKKHETKVSMAATGYGAVQPPSACDNWRDWSDPWWLLLYTAAEAGQLLLSLLMMLWMVWMRQKFTMSCENHYMLLSCACDYTKAYVRFFPLVALVISLVVASRTLLRRHFFYQMLKHGALVKLETRRPHQDPLFYFLVWCLLHVLFHFLMDFSVARTGKVDENRASLFGISSDDEEAQKRMMEEVRVFAAYYITPAIFFMVFLWTSYDTENTLLPLSKFMEGDKEIACQRLSSTFVISECDAHRAAENRLVEGREEGEEYRVSDLCAELIERVRQMNEDDDIESAGDVQDAEEANEDANSLAAKSSPGAQRLAERADLERPLGPTAQDAASAAAKSSPAVFFHGKGPTSQTLDGSIGTYSSSVSSTAVAALRRADKVTEPNDFVEVWWIAELMIDRGLKDRESKQFRHVWYVYSVISLLIIAIVACLFARAMVKDIRKVHRDLNRDQRLTERVASAMTAQLLHFFVTLFVGSGFLKPLWRPLQEQCSYKAKKMILNRHRPFGGAGRKKSHSV